MSNTRKNHIDKRFNRHDSFYHKAKKEGFAARSIYKLEEIDQAFKIIGPKDTILDLGCAPGSWMQYTSNKIDPQYGRIVGIDRLKVNIAFGPHVRIIQGDIYETKIEEFSPYYKEDKDVSPPFFNVVLSDMAPNTTGIASVDQARSIALCEWALSLAMTHLKPNGNFCVKVLEGGDFKAFYEACKLVFNKVHIKRPKSTRSYSRETFLIGIGFKPQKSDIN